ncbi:O-antigen ligase family protein [bacterium]|nr:O-antigen ligase family protein [bacterium]
MSSSVIRRRLFWIEILLTSIAFGLFYTVTNYKDLGYSVGVVAGFGILALTFFRPRYGLIGAMVLLFTESTIGVLNALAETALEYDLTGIPSLIQTQWFGWGVLTIYLVILLSYLTRELVSGRQLKPLSVLEWILLLPLLAVLLYLPISLLYGNTARDFFDDIIPMLIYGGIVVLGRVFYQPGKTIESRYYFLDWFIIFNIIILVPLWAYNIIFDTWRNGYVGIASIRYGTGPYDFNFFLVPLLGMILTYDDNLKPERRRFYQFAFFLSLARIFISMFRGAIGGTVIAIIIATYLVEKTRRWQWVRSLVKFGIVLVIIGTMAAVLFPVVRTTLQVALFARIVRTFGGAGGGDTSMQFRELETETALDEILEQPVLGYGPGKMVVKHFRQGEFAQVELYLHSAYIWFWYKMGVVGLGVLLTFFTGIIWICISLLKRKLHRADRGWVVGTISAVIAMLPVIHTNNMLIRSQGAYALTLLFFGLSVIVMRYRGIPVDKLPPREDIELPAVTEVKGVDA